MHPLTITFITGHYYGSDRKAGFHNLADAACRMGHHVNFITAGYSLLSYLRGDFRTRIPGIWKNYNKPIAMEMNLTSYVHFTAWHPMTLLLPILNRISSPLMDWYGKGSLGAMLPMVKKTDVFVFESMAGLFLFHRFKRENPSAKTVYRVSDDIRILRSTHPRLVDLEQELAPLFDCVSVPSSWMLGKFPGLGNLRLDYHGLDKSAYDACTVSPYKHGTRNAVFVGIGYLDSGSIIDAAHGNPDCRFHIIGPASDSVNLPNVRFYGEMPFSDTVPYVKFANAGLLTLDYRNDSSKSFTDSLKTIQYRYCGLPIVSPDFIDLKRRHVFYYRKDLPGSCAKVVREALDAGKWWADEEKILSWDETMDALLGCVLDT